MKISSLHVAYPLILSTQSCVHWHSGNARYKLLKTEISFHRKPAFEMASATKFALTRRSSDADLISLKDKCILFIRRILSGCANERPRAPLFIYAHRENNNHLACQRDMAVAERSLWDRLKQEPRYK